MEGSLPFGRSFREATLLRMLQEEEQGQREYESATAVADWRIRGRD